MHWRGVRAGLLRAAKIRPKRNAEPISKKIGRAFERIYATEEEKRAIRQFTAKIMRKREHSKSMGFRFVAETDPITQQLEKRTRELLGEKRADQFFSLCNDPYF